MRGTPFTKYYSGDHRSVWDRFDCLPPEYREMVANDPNGNMIEILEIAEQLAREAGLLPPLPEEKKPSKKELRAQRDRARTEAAKARSRVVYKVLLPAGTVAMKNPLPDAKKVVIKVAPPSPLSRNEHNGRIFGIKGF